MSEDLSYEELRRRGNARLTERAVATLGARGERRSVVAGEALHRADDRGVPAYLRSVRHAAGARPRRFGA